MVKNLNEEKNEIDLKKENNHNFAKSINNKYSQINSIGKIQSEIYKNKNTTASKISIAMQDPIKYSEILQASSYVMNYNSGILKEFLIYKSEILTYDHFILPIDINKYKTAEELDKAEYKACTQLEKYKIKFNVGWMTKKIMSQGSLYICETEDNESISIQEIPPSFCKAIGNKNSVMKYGIDLSKINDKNKDYFPAEIQALYEKFKKGLLKNDNNFFDNSFYILQNRAYCFNVDYMLEKGIPYYSHLFLDLINLEEMKNLDVANAKTENFKIIAQKVPTDDSGDLLIEADDAILYHEALKRELPENVGAVTSPLDINNITLGDNTAKKIDYNNKLKEAIYDGAGISTEIFNGNKSTNEAIALGAVADTLLPLHILKMIEIWLNEDFKTSSKTKNWKISFLDTSHYNKSKKIGEATSAISTYFGKKQYFATLGMTPLETYNTLKYEELSKIGEKMLPLMTSHTMSSSDIGRPINEDNLDSVTNTGESIN